MRVGLAAALSGVWLTFTLPTLGQDGDHPTVEVKRLSDRALVLTIVGPQSTNVVALRSQKGIIVIDTETCPPFAKLIRSRIEKEFGTDEFAYVINTHDHGDHTYGNQVFSDVTIIGHEACPGQMRRAEERREQTVAQLRAAVERMQQRLGSDKENKALADRVARYDLIRRGLEDGFALTPPTLTFREAMTLDLGDLTLELYHYGLSHSKTDLLVHCPEEKLLLTGDLFAAGYDPYIDSERILVMSKWLRHLDRVATWDLEHFIPGHGESLTKGELASKRDFIAEEQKKYAGKESAFLALKGLYERKGMPAAIESLKTMRKRPEAWYFLHAEMDSFAFGLMRQGKLDDALPLFHLLAEFFPDSDIAFDSLGEAYLMKGDEKLAAKYFRQALDKNPDNGNAARKLASLES